MPRKGSRKKAYETFWFRPETLPARAELKEHPSRVYQQRLPRSILQMDDAFEEERGVAGDPDSLAAVLAKEFAAARG
mgnify:CR=1 FL=1